MPGLFTRIGLFLFLLVAIASNCHAEAHVLSKVESFKSSSKFLDERPTPIAIPQRSEDDGNPVLLADWPAAIAHGVPVLAIAEFLSCPGQDHLSLPLCGIIYTPDIWRLHGDVILFSVVISPNAP